MRAPHDFIPAIAAPRNGRRQCFARGFLRVGTRPWTGNWPLRPPSDPPASMESVSDRYSPVSMDDLASTEVWIDSNGLATLTGFPDEGRLALRSETEREATFVEPRRRYSRAVIMVHVDDDSARSGRTRSRSARAVACGIVPASMLVLAVLARKITRKCPVEDRTGIGRHVLISG